MGISLQRNSHFMKFAETNREEIMICERCRGLKLLDHFYGMENDGSVWTYDGLRCLNCGFITPLMKGERPVTDATRVERANQYPLCVQTVVGS